MNVKECVAKIKRGYHRPVTLPRWKWWLIYLIWIVALLGYIMSIFISPLLLLVGMFCQGLAMRTTLKWDTGSWRNTEEGKAYISKYEGNK